MAQPGKPGGKSVASEPASTKNGSTDTPKLLGKYRLEKKLGQGGMGAVYLATDTLLNRSVALKILPRDKAANPTLVKRFKQEAKSVAALQHENIVAVFESDTVDGYAYIALEYVEGKDASKLIEDRGVVPPRRALEIVRQAARALEHAWSQGIIHRDIKPANLLIRRDGVVKLADMGLALVLDENADTNITRQGTTVGTVDYMPPEQAVNSRNADIRSDIYSLGCTWYHLLTGTPPFPEGSLTNKLTAHAKSPPPDPRANNPKIPESHVAILHRMMAKTKDQRYQTPTELLADLDSGSVNRNVATDAILEDLPPAAVSRQSVKRSASLDDDAPRSKKKSKSSAYEADDDEDAPRTSSSSGKKTKVKVLDDVDAASPKTKKTHDLLDGKDEVKERDYTLVFWGVLGALFIGMCCGIWWLIGLFSRSLDVDRTAPLTVRVGEQKAARRAPANAAAAQAAPNGGANAIDGSKFRDTERKTTIVGGEGQVDASGQPLAAAVGADGQPIAGMAVPSGPKGTYVEADFIPAWVRETSTPELKQLSVGSSGQDGEFYSLNAALEAVPPEGAVITLHGRGPFALRATQIADRTHIVIRGDNAAVLANQPIVTLEAAADWKSSALLDVAGTRLEFLNTHVVADATQLPAAVRTLISVEHGHARFSGGSLVLRGTPEQDIVAVRIAGIPLGAARQAEPHRVLFEKFAAQGEKLTPIQADFETGDLVIHKCLLVSGNAPVLRLGPKKPTPSAKRTMSIVLSTLAARQTAIVIDSPGLDPGSARWQLFGSIVTCLPGGTQTSLMLFPDWQNSQVRKALGSGFQWTTVGTVYPGWERLLASPPDSLVLKNRTEWSQHWNMAVSPPASLYSKSPWPDPAPENLAATNVSAFNSHSVPGEAPDYKGQPGCDMSSVAIAKSDGLAASTALSLRVAYPGRVASPPGNSIRVDLTKEDLGRVLSGQALPAGTEVIAYGAGARPSSPIIINGTWVKLSFQQTEGPPLSIFQRPLPGTRGDADDAFIHVRDGGLDISDGWITLPSAAGAAPRWLIRAENADLTLEHCRIEGSTASGRTQALISWVKTGAPPSGRRSGGTLDGYCVIDRCYLVGSGPLIEADIRKQALFMRQSIAVARGDIFALNLAGNDASIGGCLDLQNSTLSATGAVFNVQGAALTKPAQTPFAVFAERTVFAPPMRLGGKTSPTLLTTTGSVIEQKQLTWWERRSGYAPDFSRFITTTEAPGQDTAQKFDTAWVGTWGAASVIEPLTGPGEVMLVRELPIDRSKLGPDDFTLAKASKAASHDEGRPIGADPSLIAPAASTVATPPGSKKAAPATKPTGKPGF